MLIVGHMIITLRLSVIVLGFFGSPDLIVVFLKYLRSSQCCRLPVFPGEGGDVVHHYSC